ncbi:helix-turn-helix domain-containing protein [Paracoccus litorisediminis]|uniref:helix-turn-helix domain-containing protein n=1 Tax=Paracoccus litorisediminis TaxID=2006130 RepID=UPI00372F2C40
MIYADAQITINSLASNLAINEVTAMPTCLDGFSIGHLLFNISRKDMATGGRTAHQLLDMISFDEDVLEVLTPRSRHRAIAYLKKIGAIDASLGDKEFKPAGTTPCLRDICAIIHDGAKVTMEEIASSSRSRHVVQARFQAIWVLRTVCGHSLSMIGRHVGDRDHTTILNSINKTMVSISSDIAERDAMDMLCEKSDRLGVLRNRQMLMGSHLK